MRALIFFAKPPILLDFLTQLLSTDSSTPIPQKRGASQAPIDGEYSPVVALRQEEANAGIDVVWDWSSPQSRSCKGNPKGLRRRLLTSPKVAPKRVQAGQLQALEKLEEELQLLNGIVVTSSYLLIIRCVGKVTVDLG